MAFLFNKPIERHKQVQQILIFIINVLQNITTIIASMLMIVLFCSILTYKVSVSSVSKILECLACLCFFSNFYMYIQHTGVITKYTDIIESCI